MSHHKAGYKFTAVQYKRSKSEVMNIVLDKLRGIKVVLAIARDDGQLSTLYVLTSRSLKLIRRKRRLRIECRATSRGRITEDRAEVGIGL